MGFGKDMAQTEIVQWGATKTFSSKVDPTGFLTTYYSTGHRKPLEDDIFVNCYDFDVIIDPEDKGFVQFLTRRPLDCWMIDDSNMPMNTPGFLLQLDT